MKKRLSAVIAVLMFLSSCEVELRDNHRYYHPHGWDQHSHHEHGSEHHEEGHDHNEHR